MKIVLKRTGRKCGGKFIYTFENAIIKYIKRGKRYWNNWECKTKDGKTVCKSQDTLKGITQGLLALKEKEINMNKTYEGDGGYRCPKGCIIDHVDVPYSETAYGYERCSLDDQDCNEPSDRETTDYDNFSSEDPECPECGAKVEWYRLDNSIKFITEEDNVKTNTLLQEQQP